jgi:vancomycin permeability regulator SanA
MKTRKPVGHKVPANRRDKVTRLAFAGLVLAAVAFGMMLGADRVCRSAAAGRIFRDTNQVPPTEVALVLGTARTNSIAPAKCSTCS